MIFRITLRNVKLVSIFSILKCSFAMLTLWSKFTLNGTIGMELKESIITFKTTILKCSLYQVKFKTKHFQGSRPSLPKKYILGTELKKYIVRSIEKIIRYATLFWVNITQFSYSELAPLNTSLCWVSFKTKRLEVSGLYLPFVPSFIQNKERYFWD